MDSCLLETSLKENMKLFILEAYRFRFIFGDHEKGENIQD